MADEAHILTDRKLEEMERHLSAIFSEAEKSVYKNWVSYMSQSRKEIELLQKAYEDAKKSGDKAEIRKAGKKLQKAKKERTIMNKHYNDLTRRTAEELATVNQRAVAYMNGELAEVYVANYNALASAVDGIGGYAFELIDEATVKNLALTDKSLLPFKKLDPAKDIPWNMRNINTQVLQGILAGESMPKIAQRIRSVQQMNLTSAIRSARTIVTGAENKGRQDSYSKAEEDGIILDKEWIATKDSRTRDSHLDIDGDIVKQDAPFSNGLFFPGDPSGAPSEVYNCRCTMGAVVRGFKKVRR